VTLETETADSNTLVAAEVPPATTPAEKQLETLAADRFAELMRTFPNFATYLGVTEHDGELSDGSREGVIADIEASRAYLSSLEALDQNQLSPYHQVERDLALYSTRLQLFDQEVHRVWERRVNAADEIGDGIFLVYARGTRPLDERLSAIASRLEAAPGHIEQQKTRFGTPPPVRLWNELEIDSSDSLPTLFDDVLETARKELGEEHAETVRLERAAVKAAQALSDYATWLRGELGDATDEFALGDAYDEMVRLRQFDDLDTDAILAIGEEQLALNHEGRQRVAREIDPSATEAEVVDRVKSDHPADFPSALAAYRTAMAEARGYIAANGIASLPEGESISVIETPEFLRKVMPFAAYFSPPKFGTGSSPKGLYIVTPSIGGEARAMREHNHASIYNTSIHEAYPGHHQQLAASITHPSLVRLLVDAPEFVEGWAMYCEQMMREEGFDTAPSHLLMMYTDSIWRACRIIIDIKLQRGQITVPEAVDFLVEQTGFERPNATSEVNWYTYRPTYPLSYLLGKVLLLRLREDEKARLGSAFSLRDFHDSLLREGSLPISFHRRLLASRPH